MPNIQTYENRENVSPSSVGAEITAASAYKIDELTQRAAEATGQAISTVGRTITHLTDQYDTYQTQKEVSQGSAQIAGTTTALMQQYNQGAAQVDPNNLPAYTKNFQDNILAPALEKLSGQFTTDRAQEWAQEHIQGIQDHFSTVFAADQNTAAQTAIKQNIATTTNQYANLVHDDPSSLDLALKQTNSAIDGLIKHAVGLDFTGANTARTQLKADALGGLVYSAIKGMTDKNVDAGLKMLDDPKYSSYLTPTQRDQLTDYGRVIQRFNQEEARLDTTNGILAQNQASDAQINQVLSSATVRPDGSIQFPQGTLQTMLRDPSIKGTSKAGLADFITRNSDPTTVTPANPDPNTYQALATQAANGSLTPGAIITAHNKGLIDMKQFQLLTDEVKFAKETSNGGPDLTRLNSFLGLVKPLVDPTNLAGGGSTIQSVQAYAKLQADAHTRYMMGLKSGKTPDQLLNPSDPNYILKDLQTYQALANGPGGGGNNTPTPDADNPPPPSY